MGKTKRPCFYFCGVPQLLLLLLLLTLLSSHEEGGGGVRVAEARVCLSRSHYFHGLCKNNQKCSLVCRYEGFNGGRCRGSRRRCFCSMTC